MKRIRVLITVGVLCAFSAGANSQQDEETAGTQHSADQNQRGTEDAPVIVRILPSNDAGEQAAAGREETLNRLTAVLAGIGVLQLIVFAYQGGQMWRTVNSSMAADRACMAVHRTASNLPQFSNTPYTDIAKIAPDVINSYTNIGKTAARVHKMRLEVIIAPELPEAPDWSKSGADVSYGYIVVHPGKFIAGRRRTMMRQITEDEAIDLKRGKTNLFLIGAIVFDDIFDKTRTFVFAMKWKDDHFVPTRGGKIYNRHHKGNYPEDGYPI